MEKRKTRRKEGRFVVEGPHLVEEARDQIDFVVCAERLPILEKLEEQGVDCLKVSKKQFSEISEVETPQWILAVVKQPKLSLKDVSQGLVVFCVGVQDPGNLGTIIRTADAVGAAGIILSRGTVDLYNSKVIRSTMGSLFHLPIVQYVEPIEAIEAFKKKKIKIVAADVMGKRDYFETDFRQPIAVIVGNEGAGLPKEIISLADETVRIPMPGKAESLNVGISTAVVLYEALKQRTRGCC